MYLVKCFTLNLGFLYRLFCNLRDLSRLHCADLLIHVRGYHYLLNLSMNMCKIWNNCVPFPFYTKHSYACLICTEYICNTKAKLYSCTTWVAQAVFLTTPDIHLEQGLGEGLFTCKLENINGGRLSLVPVALRPKRKNQHFEWKQMGYQCSFFSKVVIHNTRQ